MIIKIIVKFIKSRVKVYLWDGLLVFKWYKDKFKIDQTAILKSLANFTTVFYSRPESIEELPDFKTFEKDLFLDRLVLF